jgi:hypothetical protein
MRNFKHRLRDRENEIVGYEKWYEGSWKVEDNGHGYYVAEPRWLYSLDDVAYAAVPIPHRYKDAFTGIHDKNGKEIYEGDVVETTEVSPWDDKNFIVLTGVVVFDFDGWWFDCIQSNSFDGGLDTPLTIRGNIYENPELLEAE